MLVPEGLGYVLPKERVRQQKPSPEHPSWSRKRHEHETCKKNRTTHSISRLNPLQQGTCNICFKENPLALDRAFNPSKVLRAHCAHQNRLLRTACQVLNRRAQVLHCEVDRCNERWAANQCQCWSQRGSTKLDDANKTQHKDNI